MGSGGIRLSFSARGLQSSFLPRNFDGPRGRNSRPTCCAASVAGSHRTRRFVGRVVGGAYPLEEVAQETAWGDEESLRLQRPNLRWRFFRIQSPFSHHVTMVTVEGEDREGFCHSLGSACRESRRASWNKATLEAVQGRHYVRHLRQQRAPEVLRPPLETFADHAVYYSFHREELQGTALNRARPASE